MKFLKCKQERIWILLLGSSIICKPAHKIQIISCLHFKNLIFLLDYYIMKVYHNEKELIHNYFRYTPSSMRKKSQINDAIHLIQFERKRNEMNEMDDANDSFKLTLLTIHMNFHSTCSIKFKYIYDFLQIESFTHIE